MPLVNVRLSSEDARKASELRKAGVQISRLVRQAIRAEHEKRSRRSASGCSAAQMMADIYSKYPPISSRPARTYEVHNAKAARSAIVAHLKKGR